MLIYFNSFIPSYCFDDISKNIAKDLSRGITNEFRSVVRLTDKLADNQFAMEKGRLKSKAVEKDIEKIKISKLRTELKFAELQRSLTDDKIKAEYELVEKYDEI